MPLVASVRAGEESERLAAVARQPLELGGALSASMYRMFVAGRVRPPPQAIALGLRRALLHAVKES